MHPEIENLLTMALADDEVTEKERSIILRKAESLGLDKDEVEMVLDGKIALMMKEKNANQHESKPKSNKEGDMKKCPSCGAPVQSFATKCSDCGYEFRGIEASKTVTMLFEKLDSIEKERDTVKLKGMSFLAGMGGEEARQQQIDEIIIRKKSNLIRNFPIPNTRDDLLELLNFIHPKINNKDNFDKNYRDWKTKFNEIIARAKFAYKNNKSMLDDLKHYEDTSKSSIFSYFTQMSKKKKFLMGYLVFMVLFLGIMIPFFSGMSTRHDKEVVKEKVRLESIMNKVNDAISNKDFDSALMLSAQLKWEYSDSYDSSDTTKLTKAWDEKREKMIEMINSAKQTKADR
jgi:hypothetical protein